MATSSGRSSVRDYRSGLRSAVRRGGRGWRITRTSRSSAPESSAAASRSISPALARAAEIGEPPLYRKAGYLFLTGDPARLSAMTAAAAFQRARGVSVEVLDAAGVRAKAPYAAGPILGGTFGSRDGFIDPGGLTNFFLREATRAGAKTRYGAGVTAIGRDSSGEFRLHTAAREIQGAARGRAPGGVA